MPNIYLEMTMDPGFTEERNTHGKAVWTWHKETTQAMVRELARYLVENYGAEYELGEDFFYELLTSKEETETYYHLDDLHEHIAAFSKTKPDVLFGLHWECEEDANDWGTFFYLNGHWQKQQVKIEWPDPKGDQWVKLTN